MELLLHGSMLGRIHSKYLVPNDTYFREQWHLQNDESGVVDINVSSAWDSVTGLGIRIGIFDDRVHLLSLIHI